MLLPKVFSTAPPAGAGAWRVAPHTGGGVVGYGVHAYKNVSAVTSMFALYMLAKFNFGSLEIGFSWLCMALMYMTGTVVLFNLLNSRIGLIGTSVFGMFYMGVAGAIFPVCMSFPPTFT